MKIRYVLPSLFIILLTLFIFINNRYVFVYSKKCNLKYTYGIIDARVSNSHENVVFNKDHNESDSTSHGDMMIHFAQDICENLKIQYYDASDNEGNINTNAIIDGLEWMISNKVDRVNISLSTKTYSRELESWINEHYNDIKIYASYNNLINTKDYPAMYDHVIGSGTDNRIVYKKEDLKYLSNDIKLFYDINKEYIGNSYLSIYSMLKGS